MVTEGFEQYFKLGKSFLNPWNNLGKSYMEIYRRANQEVLDITGDSLQRTVNQLRDFSNVKRFNELSDLQKNCLNNNISAMMSDFQKLMNIYLGSIEELNKSFTTHLKDQQQGNYAASSSSKEDAEKKRT